MSQSTFFISRLDLDSVECGGGCAYHTDLQPQKGGLQALLFWLMGKVRAISLAIIGYRLPKEGSRNLRVRAGK